ncbi:MAG: hypothetical protein IMZ62_14050, partial [Chloroflexi bacterium]|nr:hypothetical protein [Chloroflexota bacterium]
AVCAQAVVAEGRISGHIWLEFAGLRLLIKCAGLEQSRYQAARQRITELLDFIDQHTQTSELRPVFEQYSETMLQYIG